LLITHDEQNALPLTVMCGITFILFSFHLFHIPLILYRCGTTHVYI